MTITIAEAPAGALHVIRADLVGTLSAPFAWSAQLQARTLKLTNGDSIFILDTSANRAAVAAALNPEGANVRPSQTTIVIVPQTPEG